MVRAHVLYTWLVTGSTPVRTTKPAKSIFFVYHLAKYKGHVVIMVRAKLWCSVFQQKTLNSGLAEWTMAADC